MSVESLYKSFSSDEVDLTGAAYVDYGFQGLNDEEMSRWFQLLKDWADALLYEEGERRHGRGGLERILEEGDPAEESLRRWVKKEMHKAAIKGGLKEALEACAARGHKWPRWQEPWREALLIKVHANTFFYR